MMTPEEVSEYNEEAIEFFDYNIKGAWMGEYTPVYVYTNEE